MRRRGTRAWAAACAIPFVLVSASCGSSGGQAQGSARGHADGGSTAVTVSPGTSPPAVSSDITPRADLTNTRDVSWTSAEVVSDRRIRVHFTGGDTRCYGYSASVDETATTIAITVVEGTVPGAPEMCTAIGLVASMLVDLDAPVNGRRIVRG